MQLPGSRRRPIQQSLRLEGHLVYARLSDPILVKRATDGHGHRGRNRLRAKLSDVA